MVKEHDMNKVQRYCRIIAVILCGICGLFAACEDPVGGLGGASSGGAGGYSLTLDLGEIMAAAGGYSAARAVNPADYYYEILMNGPGSAHIKKNVPAGTTRVSIEVSIGKWDVRVNAYRTDTGTLEYQGTASLDVGPGKANRATVKMNPVGTPYTISIPAISGGTVTVSPGGTVYAGTLVTLSAVPDSGYGISSITVTQADGASVALTVEGGGYTFAMPGADVTVNAAFSLTPHTIHIPAVSGGTVTASEAGPVLPGTQVTLTATPDSGWGLISISVTRNTDGLPIDLNGNGNTRTFAMPGADVTVHAVFSQPYTINNPASFTGGTVTASLPSPVYPGTTVTLTVRPAVDYGISSISVTQADGTAVALTVDVSGYTFTMPAADVTVNAAFSATPHTVTIDPPGNGTVIASAGGSTLTAGDTVTAGTTITLTATPDFDYYLSGLTVVHTIGGLPVTDLSTTGNTRTFTMPAADVTVNATFSLTPHAISIPAVTGGTVTASPTGTVTAGTPITLTATPDFDYYLSGLTVTPSSVSVSGSCYSLTFTMPAADVTVSATFSPKPTISIPAVTGGTVTATPAGQATPGETVTLTVSPASGYYLLSLTVTPTSVSVIGTGNTRTFTMPAADVTVSAEFIAATSAGITAAISDASSGAIITLPGGTYTMNSEITVNNKDITITTRAGEDVYLNRDTSYTGRFFTVSGSSANLILTTGGGGLTLDGKNVSGSSPLVYLDGAGTRLEINDGVTLQNNRCSEGSAVHSTGTFNMIGGNITGNTASASGGAVFSGAGIMAMSGGTIANNTAGQSGGAVFVGSTGTFTMTGGTIGPNNTASTNGGGVYVLAGGSYNHNPGSGSISGNTATSGNGNNYYIQAGAIHNSITTTSDEMQ
jgi:hypothetical protein